MLAYYLQLCRMNQGMAAQSLWINSQAQCGKWAFATSTNLIALHWNAQAKQVAEVLWQVTVSGMSSEI